MMVNGVNIAFVVLLTLFFSFSLLSFVKGLMDTDRLTLNLEKLRLGLLIFLLVLLVYLPGTYTV